MHYASEANPASRWGNFGRPKLPRLNWPDLPRFDGDLTRSIFSYIHACDVLLMHYDELSEKNTLHTNKYQPDLPCR